MSDLLKDDNPLAPYDNKTKQAVKIAFDNIANDWDRLRGNPWPVLLQFFEKNICSNAFSNDLMLDLGCGNGRHTLLFTEKSRHIIGVDFSKELLKIANKNCKSQKISNVSYIMADVTALPFREEVFFRIIFLATLHHIPMRENRLESIKILEYILKSGGYCLISVWRKWQKRFFWHFFKEFFIFLFTFKSFKEFGDIYIPWNKHNGETIQRFHHLFSQREMKSIFHKTRFQIELMENLGGPTQRDNIFCILKKPD